MARLLFLYVLLYLDLTQRDAHTQSQARLAPVPEFLPTPTEVSAHKGDTAVLQCSVRNLGTKSVVWRRVNQESPLTIGTMTFVDDPDMMVEHSSHSSDWNLVLKDVSKEDAGLYECQITTADSRLMQTVQLSVLDTPPQPQTPLVPEFLPTPTEVLVHEGDTAVLQCSVRNLGPKSVVWRRVNQESPLTIGTMTFVDDPDMMVEHSSHSSDWNLVLKDVSKEDAGLYECQITTADSRLMQTVQLSVLDAEEPNETMNSTCL